MKHFIFYCSFIAFILLSPYRLLAVNHNIVTAHVSVSGVCDKCKNRIEDAAYIKGVKHASWNANTQDLTIKYDSTKTNTDAILQNIAKAGHDNEKYKATETDYNKLPNCCHYKTVKKH